MQKEIKVEDIKREAEERKCPVQKALYYVTEFLSGPMCGRCFPCAMGAYEARIRLQNIVEGRGKEADLLAIKRINPIMLGSSMCKKGKDTARYIMEWTDAGVFEEHIEGRCPERECLALTEYRIIPENCITCGLCKEACKYQAIIGEKARPHQRSYVPFEIRQKRCIKCGECMKVCPTGAIVIVESKSREPVGV